MNIFSILNAAIYFILGTIILVYVFRVWNRPEKQETKYSEILYGIFYLILGYYLLIYLDVENIPPDTAYKVQMYLFIGNLIVLIWLLPLNLWKEQIKCKLHPELIENDPLPRKYDVFLKTLEEKYKKNTKRQDFIKDLSRKALHIIQLSVILLIHVYSYKWSFVEEIGLTPLAFRNTLFFFLGGLFLIMFTLEDLYRLNSFHCCPNWARNWLMVSLDYEREKWTFVSSVPFLQTMFLFIFAPPPVLFGTAIVSCIADSIASIVGKAYGKHKLTFGFHRHKSYEGLIAGMISAFIGVSIVFLIYPFGSKPEIMALSMGLIAAVIFGAIDVWGKFIADNVLNTLIPGLIFWALWIVFQ